MALLCLLIQGKTAVKIFAAGQLDAGGDDRKCLIRLNGAIQGYKSFVIMDGDANAGEWDEKGFYVGRNGWHLDANFSIEYTIAAASLPNKKVGHGMATFANGDNRILGYTSNGFLLNNSQISKVELLFTGGVFSGTIKVFAF